MTAASGKESLTPEDAARSACYALVGRLMYGPPDEVVRQYVVAQDVPDEALPLAVAWRELQAACRDAVLDDVRSEYDDLFVGVGKAPVTLYTAAYAAPHGPDRHLLALRERLGHWGLVRREEAGEAEDHISGVCDVMRWLIETGQGVDVERRFFFDFLAPAAEPLCSAIAAAPQAAFYGPVAAYLAAFFAVERAAFELLEDT